MPLHTSGAPGLTVGLASSQSVALVTLPATGPQLISPVLPAAPTPSPSASGYQLATGRPSSLRPSQSSSRPLQTSEPSGCTSGSSSLQSKLLTSLQWPVPG